MNDVNDFCKVGEIVVFEIVGYKLECISVIFENLGEDIKVIYVKID